MTLVFQNITHQTHAASTLSILAMGLLLIACTSTQPFTQSTIKDDVFVDTPRGAVFFHTTEDGWFRTTHPFDLSPEVITTLLKGVHIVASPSGRNTEAQVFSEDDIRFLSPLLNTALLRATRRQVVGFRVVHDLDGRQETTRGSLYVQGRLLHLTLTHYRARYDDSETGDVTHRLNPNPMGLDQSQITFTPEAVRRSSRHEQPDVIDSPPLTSLVIDYEALLEGMTLPPTSIHAHPIHQGKGSLFKQILDPAFPANEVPASHDRSIPSKDASRSIQAPSSGKEGELKALKDEVRRLQQKLSELEGNAPTPKQP